MLNTTIGGRVKTARQRLGLSMQKFIDIINTDPGRPQPEKDLLYDRYKSWEYGVNEIPSCWIPTICKHLSCDTGYLFGEYEELTRQKASIRDETGLSETAIEVLQSLNRRSIASTLIKNILDTVNLILEHTDERRSTIEIVPFLETLSGYLNCDPEDDRIVSVELDGSVQIFPDRSSFENQPGEALSGDYMRQIIKTRLEQRVTDELRNLWNEKNGESRLSFYNRMIEESKRKK